MIADGFVIEELAKMLLPFEDPALYDAPSAFVERPRVRRKSPFGERGFPRRGCLALDWNLQLSSYLIVI